MARWHGTKQQERRIFDQLAKEMREFGTVAGVLIAAIALPSLITGLEIVVGLRMRLLTDEVSFREAFSRFPNDEPNGLSNVTR